MIAMNCSADDIHFMKRNDNGEWYEKVGVDGPFQHVDKEYVSKSTWLSRRVKASGGRYRSTPTYSSGTMFIAVKKNWREYIIRGGAK